MINEIELTTVNAAGDRAVYVVELEEQPPHGIAGIRLQ